MNLQPGDATPTHIGNGAAAATPSRNRWDDASGGTLAPGAATPQWTNPDADDDFESKGDASARRRSRWDLTPSAETPRSFDFTPKVEAGGATPSYTMTPGGATPIGPIAMGFKTPAHITN
uniref:Splicing factor 3B subunit 1 domain-containing protein n=1 Tax=Panagrolaimus davidi TaxID=227884 RepID=A0A914P4I1_9BILA